jgi:hypothetical protein
MTRLSFANITPARVFNSSGNNIYYTQGNVGFGKTNPQYALDVSGTLSATNIRLDGNLTLDVEQADAKVVFGTKNTLVIDPSLNRVGVNVALPSSALDVSGNVAMSGNVNIDSGLIFANGTTNRVGINNSNPNAVLDVSGNAVVSGNLNVDSITLVVDASNNRVGIGKSDPSVALDVSGYFIGLPQVAIFQDQKSQGVAGGASVSGFATRTLNTVVYNTITGASLSSNVITLPAGTYKIEASIPSHSIQFFGALQRSSDTIGTNLLLRGTSATAGNNSYVNTISVINGILTVPTTTGYRIVQCSVARSDGGDALGYPTNLGTEIYTTVTITLLSR